MHGEELRSPGKYALLHLIHRDIVATYSRAHAVCCRESLIQLVPGSDDMPRKRGDVHLGSRSRACLKAMIFSHPSLRDNTREDKDVPLAAFPAHSAGSGGNLSRSDLLSATCMELRALFLVHADLFS